MSNDIKKGSKRVIEINEGAIRGELTELVRHTVEETLNDLLGFCKNSAVFNTTLS